MARQTPKKYGSKDVTNHLREMAAEAHTMADDGSLLTRGEALALLLWKKALGYEDKTIDEEGRETVVKVEPAAWAIQLVYERMEGKVPQAIVEEDVALKAADAVREIAANRFNALAAKAAERVKATAEVKTGPPTFKKKPDVQ